MSILKAHLIAIVGIILLTGSFMGRSLTHCNDTVIGSVGGDHLSGIIWLLKNTEKPYGGISHVSNYPFGESVSQPQLITSAIPMTSAWLLNKAVGPVCAWNIMVFIGYTSGAFMMYGLVFWLFRRRDSAFLGAVGVAFTPYHYFKTHGHLSYVFSVYFVAILWAFLYFWKKPAKKTAALLGLAVAASFYGDGYFPLFTGMLLFGIGVYCALKLILKRKDKKYIKNIVRRIKLLLLGALITSLALLPIVFVRFHYKDQISSSLSSARGNIMEEAQRYGARPTDYLLPSETHPIATVSNFVKSYRINHPHSNIGEYHLYLGVVMLLLASYAIIYFALHKKIKDSSRNYKLLEIAGVGVVVAFIAGMMSFSPNINIFGHHVLLPSGYLVKFVSLWRVFARLYLIVNIGVTLVAVVGFSILMQRLKKPIVRLAVGITIITFAIIDLMPINPISRTDEWSLKNDSHSTYWWLNKQKNIPAIVAYPILEAPLGTSYFSDQLVHEKPFLNSVTTRIPELNLHRALYGLGDQQTLGGLKGLGVEYLLLYQTKLPNESNKLDQLFGDYGARVVRINQDVKALRYVLVPVAGFSQPQIDKDTQISCSQSLGQQSIISTRKLSDTADDPEVLRLGFDIKGVAGGVVIFHSASSVLAEVTLLGENLPVHLNIDTPPGSPITMYRLDSNPVAVSICNPGVNE